MVVEKLKKTHAKELTQIETFISSIEIYRCSAVPSITSGQMGCMSGNRRSVTCIPYSAYISSPVSCI